MNFPRNLIRREEYIERIIPFIQKNIVKVLTGQRRVGKSFLLYQLMEHILQKHPDANLIYLNFEDFAYSKIQTADKMYDYILSESKKGSMNYIFIDEIQEVADFEKAIRSLLLNPDNDIYITGSNAKMLSGELATYLSGRYVEFKIYSLSYNEFLQFHKLDDCNKNLELYSRYGGLPYLANLPLKDEVANEYLKSIYSTIVFRDVVSRYNLRNTLFLEKLVRFLSENIGSLFSAKNISDYLKSQHSTISVNQVQNYTEYLSNAYLIHRAERYDLIGKRIFEIGEKYYFENMGIRNIVAGYRIADKGKIMENLIYNHLLYKGYNIRIGYYGDKEIDFIGEKNGEKIYIQAAQKIDSEQTAEREFGNLMKIQDNYPKIVVTEDGFEGNTHEGIKTLPLRYFLANFPNLPATR